LPLAQWADQAFFLVKAYGAGGNAKFPRQLRDSVGIRRHVFGTQPLMRVITDYNQSLR